MRIARLVDRVREWVAAESLSGLLFYLFILVTVALIAVLLIQTLFPPPQMIISACHDPSPALVMGRCL